jgi:hypothetical protein
MMCDADNKISSLNANAGFHPDGGTKRREEGRARPVPPPRLLFDEAHAYDLSREVELSLFYDRRLDLQTPKTKRRPLSDRSVRALGAAEQSPPDLLLSGQRPTGRVLVFSI